MKNNGNKFSKQFFLTDHRAIDVKLMILAVLAAENPRNINRDKE